MQTIKNASVDSWWFMVPAAGGGGEEEERNPVDLLADQAVNCGLMI